MSDGGDQSPREIPHRDLKRARHEEDLDVEALMRQLTQRLDMATLGTRRVGQEWTITAHFTSKRFYWENHSTGEWYWDYFHHEVNKAEWRHIQGIPGRHPRDWMLNDVTGEWYYTGHLYD